MDTRISLATTADAEEILALVHAAFAPVAEEYGVATLPPLQETLADLLADFRTHVILKAAEDGRIVGSVRAALFRGTCEVGRLVVDPGSQGHGVGTALARAIEARFPEADRFELFTGHRSGPSLHIYGNLGYVPFRIETVSDSLQLVYMRKPGPGKQGMTPRG
jgi:GNAT superfamily N-acetyltransferase